MRHFILLLILCCAAIGAADPVVASNAALAQAKAEQEYRSYLTALAKAYQTETAKFEAQMKREATGAKKDPDTLAAVTALQEKVKAGKQLADLRELIDGKLLSGDAVAAEKIAGNSDLLLGKWNIVGVKNLGSHELSVTINPRGKARLVIADDFTNMAGKPDVTHDDHFMTWVVTDTAFVIDDVWQSVTGGQVPMKIEIALPLPMTGDVISAKFSVKNLGNTFTDSVTLERVPAAPAAK